MAKARQGIVKRALASRANDALFGLSDSLPRLIEAVVAEIEPNPDQPRKRLDQGALQELAASIERHGLMQPIVVRASGEGAYALVAGQRRLAAYERLGRATIPALLATGDAAELALIENLQRADLDPLDEAEALASLKARHGYSQDQLAAAMAKAKSTVSELLGLNTLPEAIKAEVRTSELPIPKSTLIEIARLKGEPARAALWQKLKRGGTVRAARAAKGRAKGQGRGLAHAVTRLERQLTDLDGGALDAGARTALDTLRRRIDTLLG